MVQFLSVANMTELGDRIKKLRKLCRVSQGLFSEMFGVTSSHISKLETGKATPSDQLIKSICRELDVREEWLRTGEGPITLKTIDPQAIGEYKTGLVLLHHESFMGILKSLIRFLEVYKQSFQRHNKKLKDENLLTDYTISEPDMDNIRQLQDQACDELDEIKTYVLGTDKGFNSFMRVFRVLNDVSKKDFYLLTAIKGERLEEEKKRKLKKDIAILKKASK